MGYQAGSTIGALFIRKRARIIKIITIVLDRGVAIPSLLVISLKLDTIGRRRSRNDISIRRSMSSMLKEFVT